MLIDLIPSRFILGSLAAHGLLVAVFAVNGIFDQDKTVSLMDQSNGSVEVLFSAPPEEIKKELKKHIKKIIKKKKAIADVGDKIEKKEEEKTQEVRQVSLEDIKSLSNLSPEMKAFLRSLKAQIQSRQVYPYAAKRLRQTGQVVVRFDVSAQGDVQNVTIEKKSEHKRLDSSAYKLISGISKVKSPPKSSMSSDIISIVVPIEYKL